MFGVGDRGGTLEVVGVVQVDKVQNEFLSALRSRQKINRAIGVAEDVVETDGKTLLVFHIPESPRSDKPVYLDGDIRRSFIRRGAGDERCTPAEIRTFSQRCIRRPLRWRVFGCDGRRRVLRPGIRALVPARVRRTQSGQASGALRRRVPQ